MTVLKPNLDDIKQKYQDEIVRLDNLANFILVHKDVIIEDFQNLVSNGNYHFSYKDFNGEARPVQSSVFFSQISNDINWTKETFEQLINKILEHYNQSEQDLKPPILKYLLDFHQLSNQVFPSYASTENILYSLLNGFQDLSKYKAIIQLIPFSDIKNNVVILGPNGSGKTIFSKQFKYLNRDFITLIPAHKTLVYNPENSNIPVLTKEQMREELIGANAHQNLEINYYQHIEQINNNFTKLLLAMESENNKVLLQFQKNDVNVDFENTIYIKAQEIFEDLFPGVSFELTGNPSNKLVGVTERSKYNFNNLSEGERAGIYYILSVLFSKEDGIIIVDEPETYLNPAIVKRLWDRLISEKPKSQFIFITHSVDFVSSIDDVTVAWIKDFSYPSSWDFKFLDPDSRLPKELLTTILGSKKDLLFCEGKKNTSYDYQVYSTIFGDIFTVIPVGGHNDVYSSVKAIRESSEIDVSAYGIIDGDNLTEPGKIAFKKNNIVVSNFNEIEMLFYVDEIMEICVTPTFNKTSAEIIADFKSAFWKQTESDKDKIILSKVKNYIDDVLKFSKIPLKSAENIKNSVNDIFSKIDVEEIYKKYEVEINDLINDRDYLELLRVCNLKNTISKKLTDEHFDSGYINRVVQKLITDHQLREKIKVKYFPSVSELLMSSK